jgi:predicted flavoprotein YhiN
MCFNVIENSSFEQAQVALGGVKGNEIDENTMKSKLVENLYICGEAIDICGDCGGYNLHFAFTSGIIAGANL